MTMEHRADLTGADKAVSEVLDEINVRMHGLMSSGSFHREFLDWLAERGYSITPSAGSPDTGQAREPDGATIHCALDRVGSVVESLECVCPDANIKSACYVPYCPQHAIGPRIMEAVETALRVPSGDTVQAPDEASRLANGIRRLADGCKFLLDYGGLDARVARSMGQHERNLRALLGTEGSESCG